MSFRQWRNQVDTEMWNRFGVGMDDAGDATWRDYFEDELSPAEAVDAAQEDGYLF